MSNSTKPALSLKPKTAAQPQPSRPAKPPVLFIKPAADGQQISTNVPEQDRGRYERIKTVLTKEQRDIVERIAANSDPAEPLTVLIAASRDEYAACWPIGAVAAAFGLAGLNDHGKALWNSLYGFRASRFHDAATASLEVVKAKEAAKHGAA